MNIESRLNLYKKKAEKAPVKVLKKAAAPKKKVETKPAKKAAAAKAPKATKAAKEPKKAKVTEAPKKEKDIAAQPVPAGKAPAPKKDAKAVKKVKGKIKKPSFLSIRSMVLKARSKSSMW